MAGRYRSVSGACSTTINANAPATSDRSESNVPDRRRVPEVREMESHRFDDLTQRFVASTRRQALAAFVAGAIAPLFWRTKANEVAAKCKGYKGKCKKKSSCCEHVGLECRKDRCRCKKGWKRCSGSGPGCTHVKADSDNCGACGHECPPETPCCINGACREMCGGDCCADCFVDEQVDGSDTCCAPGSGAFCKGNKKDPSDDVCCWPDQECVAGECCSDGYDGAVICGGKCCANASCCNGECCPEGQVCAMTTDGLACVPANRTCADCFPDESCVDGTCCKGDRICSDQGVDFCCPAGEYCDFLEGNGICCPINTQCKSTYRGHRVRK
jgi:hypothetical protein